MPSSSSHREPGRSHERRAVRRGAPYEKKTRAVHFFGNQIRKRPMQGA
jgi:hypothetical protein